MSKLFAVSADIIPTIFLVAESEAAALDRICEDTEPTFARRLRQHSTLQVSELPDLKHFLDAAHCAMVEQDMIIRDEPMEFCVTMAEF